MAQLRDTVIQGSARVTDTLYANELSIINSSMKLLSLINTDTLSAINIANGINFGNATTTVGHIGAETGSLGIYSLGAIAIRPNTSISGTSWLYNTGIKVTSTQVIPASTDTISLGTSSAKWSDLYATLISPDRIRVNTNLTWDVSAYDFYVSGSSRFYLGSSTHAVADRKFTIVGSNELSFGDEGIQAYTDAQAVKDLWLQPRGGNLYFGPTSSTSATAYSFQPNANNQHNLGTSSAKWANIYVTTVDTDTVKTHYITSNTSQALYLNSPTGNSIYLCNGGADTDHWMIKAKYDYTLRFNIRSGTSYQYASNNHTLMWVNSDDSAEYGYIGMGNAGSLAIATKTAIALWPGSNSTTAGTLQASQGIRFFKDHAEPMGDGYSLGTSSAKWTNVYATNLYGALATSNLTGQVAIANGGTGAASAADARTNLELGSIATYNNDYFLSLRGISTVASGTDIDTIKTMGNYYQQSNSNVTHQQHLPRGGKAFTLKIYYGSGYNSNGLYMHQLYQAYDTLLHFERRTNSNSVYGDWYYSPIAQAVFSVNTTSGNHEYTLTKGSSSLPVYINSDGEIQPVSSLTPGGIVYGDASGAYASTAAGSSGQYLKSNGSDAPTWETLIGTGATNAAAGNHGHGNITNDGKCGSANRIIVTNSSQQMTTTAQLQYDISNSTLTASGTIATKVLNVGPPSEAYANSLTGDINFYYDNSTNSTIRAHIGSSHSQDADASLFGLYATGAIVMRPGAAYDSTTNRLSTTTGVKFTSTTIEPSITDSTSLGTSTLKWSNIYSTTATLNGLNIIGGDLVMSEASGHGNTHKLIFQRGTATDQYSNWKLYNDSVGVLTLQVYHNGLAGDTDIIEILPPTNGGQIPTVQPGTTDSYKLGTSSLQWLSTYSKQFIVDTHVTLVYNSSDLSLNFNFS